MTGKNSKVLNQANSKKRGVICYLVNVAWYFELHWQERAKSAIAAGWDVHLLAGQIPRSTRKSFEFEGIQCHEIPLSRGSFNPLKLLATLIYVRRILQSINADVLHCITLLPNLIGGLIAKRKNESVICSITGTGWVFSGNTLLVRTLRYTVVSWFRWIARNPTLKFIFENQDDLALFRKLGIATDRNAHLILGAGVDTQLYSPLIKASTPLELSDNSNRQQVTFLFASRFLYSKGLGELVEVVQVLHDEGYHCSLRICGFEDKGNPDYIPVEILEQWKALPFVEWLGQRWDMAAVLQSSHVLVLPTSYGEGIPRILIEAAACGLACIATDVAGCREIVQDGVTGILVKPNDATSLKNALKYFIKSPEIAAQLGKAGRELVLERFDQIYVNAATLKLYECMT